MFELSEGWALVLVTLFLTITTFILALVAAFQDKIRSWVWKPKLEIEFELKESACSKVLCRGRPESVHHQMKRNYEPEYESEVLFVTYFIRAIVSNNGNISAKNIEVIIDDFKKFEKGKWSSIFFPFDNLVWSSLTTKGEKKIYCEYISPGTGQYINIGHIYDPHYFRDKNYSSLFVEGYPRFYLKNFEEALFCFDVNMKTNDQYFIIEPGKYKFKIKAGAENCKSLSREYELEFTGNFTTKEDEMYSKEMILKETNN